MQNDKDEWWGEVRQDIDRHERRKMAKAFAYRPPIWQEILSVGAVVVGVIVAVIVLKTVFVWGATLLGLAGA